jgi:hypothetical protein
MNYHTLNNILTIWGRVWLLACLALCPIVIIFGG